MTGEISAEAEGRSSWDFPVVWGKGASVLRIPFCINYTASVHLHNTCGFLEVALDGTAESAD